MFPIVAVVFDRFCHTDQYEWKNKIPWNVAARRRVAAVVSELVSIDPEDLRDVCRDEYDNWHTRACLIIVETCGKNKNINEKIGDLSFETIT